MVLIDKGGSIHPDEPAYCISETEVAQKEVNAFWVTRLGAGYELLITLVKGDKERVTNSSRTFLGGEIKKRVVGGEISDIHIGPVVVDDKPQPKGKLAGSEKPAVYRSWNDAREFCQGMYKGGDLPTIKQWDKACGNGEYCTSGGGLSHSEAVYYDPDKGEENGPMDVGSKPPNTNGVYDMTGNVWEWLRDATSDGSYRYYTGGSWGQLVSYTLSAAYRGSSDPDSRDGSAGFRCVAPPEDSSK